MVFGECDALYSREFFNELTHVLIRYIFTSNLLYSSLVSFGTATRGCHTFINKANSHLRVSREQVWATEVYVLS